MLNFVKSLLGWAFFFIITANAVFAAEPSGAPILRIETEMHTYQITQISVDAHERFLLTASDDKTLRLWDLTTGELIKTYRIPIGTDSEGELYAGAISPDGELVAGGGLTGAEWEQTNSIYLFNRVTGKMVKRLYGLQNVISHLCFSPDGQYLAASLGSGGIRVWETQHWEQVFGDVHYGDSSQHCVFDTQNRLLTTSFDGYLRLYSPSAGSFTLTVQRQMWYEQKPWTAEFSPAGDKIAVSFFNTKSIYVLDVQTLGYLFSPDVNGVDDDKIFVGIAWSPDGQQLCAGGTYDDNNGVDTQIPIRCWSQSGQGSYTDCPVSKDVIRDIHFLQNGDLVYGTQEPSWGVLGSEGKIRLGKQSPLADYRGLDGSPPILLVSQDGSVVQFGFGPFGSHPARFSLMEQQLVLNPAPDSTLLPPDQTSLNITNWYIAVSFFSRTLPKLNDTTLSFPSIGTAEPEKFSTALAISPDKSSFLLGSQCCLRLFDAQGQHLGGIYVSATVLTVNISGDGQKAIVALGDGTIRWYNLSNGEELLAFFPHTDGQRWIAWTPSGYYMSSGEDADNLLGWHVNHGRDQEASFYPVGQKYSKTYKRPDVVQRTLVALSEKKALEELQAENTPNEPPKTPILRVETGMHTAHIDRFDIDADEQFLVTASQDKTLRLWELATGKLVTTYRVPIAAGEGRLFSTAISPNGQLIATAGDTGTAWDEHYSIYLFNRATGQLVGRLTDLPGAVHHLCFSPDGQYFAASLEKGLQVWETRQATYVNFEYGDVGQSCQFDSNNRLLTTSFDGYLRLYSATSSAEDVDLDLIAETQPPGGKQPFHAVFSSNGDKIAVGFSDSTQVNVLNGQTLELLYSPDTSDINDNKGNKGKTLFSVAWSPDGQRLCASGQYLDGKGSELIRCWSQGGQGEHTDWRASGNTITQLRFLKNGDLVYGSADPSWGILDSEGNKKQEHLAPIADYRSVSVGGNDLEIKTFLVSYDGSVVQFGFEQAGSRPARFSLKQQLLLLYPSPDSSLQLADTSSLNITDWQHNLQPKLNGAVLPLGSSEVSRSLAIAPDKSTFLLGTEYALRLFDVTGKLLWNVSLPSQAWAVNISGDGQKAIATLGDGTIHWYSMATGEELLALFPHTDGKRWIAWTPSGYYMSSSEDADNLIGWHVNQGKDQAAKFYPINALPTEYQEISADNSKTDRKRPDIVKKVLDTLTEDKAILVANLERGIDAGRKISPEELAELLKKYDVNPTPSGLGKAIIVAASGPKSGENANTLFDFTNKFTERMYNLLHELHFSDSDVIYINPYPPAIPSGNYEEIQRRDFPLRDPLNELKQAFDQVASELKSGQQFIFYLHGHAEYQRIQLRLAQGSETSVDLSAQELKELLAQIPKDVLQIIILDTCHSGSFLAELAGIPNRIVVTSADSDSLAWTSDKGKSFADQFLRVLEQNNHVYEAFKEARRMILKDTQTFGSQSPQLDDNQDGQYIEDEDGQLAREAYIGGKKVSASLPPVITEVHPAIYLDPQETTATLWVKTSVDMNTVNKVQAILTNETDKPTQYQGAQTQFARRDITLTPNYELQRFETEYNGFQAAKQWRIFYQVETIEGQWSDFEEGFVRTDNDASAVTLETIMNKTDYQAGDPFRFEVITTGEGNFDLYVGLIFPEGNYYTIRSPFQFSAQNELLPYLQNLQLAEPKTFTILSLSANLLPTMLFGEYQACSLLTKVQSDPNDHNNWVKLHCQPFRF